MQQSEFLQREGPAPQPGKPQREAVGAYVRQLAQRAVWDLKSRTLQKGTRFRNLTLGDAPVGKREKKQKTGPSAWENQAGSPALSRRVPWTSTVRVM